MRRRIMWKGKSVWFPPTVASICFGIIGGIFVYGAISDHGSGWWLGVVAGSIVLLSSFVLIIGRLISKDT